MRVVSWVLAACIAMALLKLAVAALAIALCVLLLWGAIHHPREAVSIVAIFAFVAVAESNPAIVIALIAIIAAACLIAKAI